MHRKGLFLLVFCCLLTINPAVAAKKVQVPEPLQPWVDWVLFEHQEELTCTPHFDEPGNFRCNWPTALNLDLDENKGTFSQQWYLENEGWLQLPGNEQIWPDHVLVNGKPPVILERNNAPKVRLPPGKYTVSGTFAWRTMPEFLQINPHTALLSLRLKGKAVDFPTIDDSGRVWLHAPKTAKKVVEDRLQLQSFRLIEDLIPARTILQLNLDVAGSAREVLLGAPLPPDKFIPLSLTSSLPARFEKDGSIRIQLRPGQWSITLTARHRGPLSSLNFSRPDNKFWPEEEVWVFAKQNNRIIEIEGVTPIDPQQTALPPQWRNLPAYRLQAGDRMAFKEIKRGDPQPAPDQLSLQRNLWLRFDGSGYTIQDQIAGQKTSDWRLEMAPPLKLGRVSVDGAEQFITRRHDSQNTGIELRNGIIKLSADSEYQGPIGTIPATGWAHDFQQVSARLFLPPGYVLLHASGVDNIPATWLNRWTLLDVFIVLIFTIALARIYGWRMAAIGLATMTILYHEPHAPRWIWLAILIGVALVRNVPAGKFRKAVKIYHLLAFLVLIIIAIPFSIKQLRTGIYPQLEKPWHSMSSLAPTLQPAAPEPVEQRVFDGETELAGESIQKAGRMADLAEGKIKSRLSSLDSISSYYSDRNVAQYDPSMINQTGPGIPAWQWNTIAMSWSGPVERNQQIGLVLIGPTANLVLAILRVVLLITLALGILGVRFNRGQGWQLPDRKSFLVVPLLILALLTPTGSSASDLPSPELLQELQRRLLEKDECFPACADITDMSVSITPQLLAVEFTVAARIDTAVPVPGNPAHWLAQSAKIDGAEATAMYRTGQQIWLLIPKGNHAVRLQGKVPANNTLQLPLPLKPHRLTINNTGWTVEGAHQDGSIDNQLQFKRIEKQVKQAGQILDTGVLPPFAIIERTLLLGLDWKIETTVRRGSPTGAAIIIDYLLLPGEAVVAEGIRVAEGKAFLNLDAQTSSLRFASVLEKSDTIILSHAETDRWTEIWQVDASPIFHLEHEGIPVILHQVGNRWAPRWHPWPGEEVTLRITRPGGIAGQTITIDKSHLEVRPGRRATDVTLNLALRSSQGGQHTIVLPADSQLQEVRIDGQVQPIRQEGRNIPLPVSPGSQSILLKWRETNGITASFHTPEVDLGLPGANNNVDLHLPANRWPLVVAGPVLGPAILFWSVILVIIMVAFGLAKSNLTHLKFYQWLLLGIGMSQSNLTSTLLVVGWLIALEYRKKAPPDMDKGNFNLMQIGLGLLTLLALSSLVYAVSRGLLGHPDMNIVGNGSHSTLLRWYQDYSLNNTIPQAWLLSIPMFWYRLAMLAWALWISFILVNILKYGWESFANPVLWHQIPKKPKLPDLPPQKDSMAQEAVDLSDQLQVEEE